MSSSRYDNHSQAFADHHGQHCAAVPWTKGQFRLTLVVVLLVATVLVLWPIASWTVISWAAAMCFGLWMGLRLVCAVLSRCANPSLAVTAEDLAALGDDLPRYTVLVPLYREPEVVPHLLAAMRALDYPRDKLDLQFLLGTGRRGDPRSPHQRWAG